MSAARPERQLWPWNLAATVAYSLTLLIAYAHLVAPVYSYLGYTWVTPNYALLGLAVAELGALSLLLPARLRKPSDFMLLMIFATVVVPVLTIGNVIGLLTTAQIALLCFFTGAAFAVATLMARWGHGHVTATLPHLPARWYWAGVGAFIAATILILVAVGGVRLEFTGLTEVYDIRDDYKTSLAAFPPLAYMVPAACYVAIPLVIIRGLHRRSWVPVVVGIACQGFIYLQTGFKTFLFAIPVLLVLTVLIRRTIPTALLPAGLAAGVVGAGILDVVTNSVWFSSLFTRRFLATPGQLAANYVAFFDEHRFVFLSEGLLRGLITYPYDMPVPFVIGREIHGVTTNSSNVNLFGDGFAQAGWPGMLIAGVAFGALLILVDLAAKGLPASVGFMLMFLPCIVLGNASILTAMLSHGLAAAVLLLALAPRAGWTSARQDPEELGGERREGVMLGDPRDPDGATPRPFVLR
ncbi:MAG: hypothetical protein IPJ61_03375 [Tessaracoccus sp.]|uniref:hypothetical protein n=1 Tax=Tessaracoccus sp. TaxID=1971211 RepID=UPI001ECE1EE7|nr:hypothetical protein [Tessaracoccus sp.]MBK7820125.1 hypothetical protein [Tessaracoccus sp.]